MADCDRALELISAKIDGELTGEEAAWLENHLEHCPDCRALAADFAALHQLLPALAPEPPAELKGRIMDAVRAEKTVPFPDPARKKPRRRWKAWASVAAVAALVFLGGRAALPALSSGGASIPATAGAPAGAELPAADTAQAPELAPQEAPAAEADDAQGQAKSGSRSGTERTAEPDSTAQPEPDGANGRAGITTMMAAPTPAPLDEAGALEALLAHLGLTEADGADFSPLGLSGDGTAWRFQRTEDGAVYSVPLDGGEITQEPQAEQTE